MIPLQKFSMHVAICMNISGIDMNKIPISDYKKAVSKVSGISEALIMDKCRKDPIIEARHLVIYLANTMDNYNHSELAEAMHIDRSSVINAIKNIRNRIDTNHNNIKQTIQQIKQIL